MSSETLPYIRNKQRALPVVSQDPEREGSASYSLRKVIVPTLDNSPACTKGEPLT